MFCVNIKKACRLFFLIAIFDLACLPSMLCWSIRPFMDQEVRFGLINNELLAQEANLAQLNLNNSEAPEGLGKYLGKFKVTFYWIIREGDYNGEKDTPLYLESGKVLGYFPYRFVSAFKKEAAAELKDGKLISYLKKMNKVRVVREFLGYTGYTINPLKSIAVDPECIPLGSKVYIPALTKVVDHNGTMFAQDIGSMIKGHDIDIFVGHKENMKLLTRAGIESSSLVDVYLLE